MFFDVDCWPSAGFLFGLQSYVRLTFCKQGWVVHKPVDTNPGLKVNRIINCSCIQVFYIIFILYFEIIQTKNRRTNNTILWKTSSQSCKTQSKLLSYPGLHVA